MPTSPDDCTRKLVSGSAHVSPAVSQFAIEEMARLRERVRRLEFVVTIAERQLNMLKQGGVWAPASTKNVRDLCREALGPVSLAEQAANQRREISKDRTVPK